MDGFYISIKSIFFIVFFSPLAAWAGGCDKPAALESVEACRACYGSTEAREDAFQRALALLDTPEKQAAEAELFFVKGDPFSVRARESYMHVLFALGKKEKAFKELLRIGQLERSYFSDQKIAELALQCGKYGPANRFLSRLLKDQPGNLDLRRLRAVSYFELHDYKSSLEDLRFFLGSRQEDGRVKLALAKVHLRVGEKKEARSLVKELHADRDKQVEPELLADFGLLAEMAGEGHIAEESYREDIRRGQSRSLVHLARRLKDSGKGKEAESLLLLAEQRIPGNDQVLRSLIDHYVFHGSIFKLNQKIAHWSAKYPKKEWLKAEFARIKRDMEAKVNAGGLVESFSLSPGGDRLMPAVSPPLRAPAQASSVKVLPGDSLMTISYRVFGTHQRWEKLWELNKELIKSPDRIEPGMSLAITKVSEGE
jgi:tetratricopeptide (TPR) repeat protein